MSLDPVTANPFAEAGERGHQGTAALGRLLGGTRSSVLRVIAATPGLTMAELAYRADIALATASEHASVLREAGLVTRHRDGNRVRHYPTATAMALLGTAGGREPGLPKHEDCYVRPYRPVSGQSESRCVRYQAPAKLALETSTADAGMLMT